MFTYARRKTAETESVYLEGEFAHLQSKSALAARGLSSKAYMAHFILQSKALHADRRSTEMVPQESQD